MINRFTNRLIAILLITFIFSTSAVFFLAAVVLWIVTRPFDEKLWLLHRFTSLWASLYIWVFPPWSVNVIGREKIDKNKTYIIVSNHQSLVDILSAFMLFTHFKWVSKSELFRIPLIGWNMSLNRYVRLERGRKASVKRMYKACERHLNQGSSLYLFPEGTRSATGLMREFKEGAFILAKRNQVSILPIVINGSKNAVPKDSLNFHGRSHIELEILDALAPESFKNLSSKELAQHVRELIRMKVAEEREHASEQHGSLTE